MLQRLVLFVSLFTLCGTAQAPGQYAGTWASSSSGSAGKIALAFTGADLTSASFTMQGQDIKAKPISFRKMETECEFVFEYSIDGNVLRSKMLGTVTAKSIKGKYNSTTPDGTTPVDEGTWEATLQ